MSNTKIQVQETQNKQDKYQNKLTKNPELQERILEWVAVPFSRDLPNPGIKPVSPALQANSLPLSHRSFLT